MHRKKIGSFQIYESRCGYCKAKNRKRCFHWPVGNKDSIVKFQEELKAQMQKCLTTCGRNFDYIFSKTKIFYNPSSINNAGDKYNIDFDPYNDDNQDSDVIFFNTLVNQELRLRSAPIHGTLEEKRVRLKQLLMLEQRLIAMKEAISRSKKGKDAALMLIKLAIPCIMHLENRVGEKIITFLLSFGADRYHVAAQRFVFG